MVAVTVAGAGVGATGAGVGAPGAGVVPQVGQAQGHIAGMHVGQQGHADARASSEESSATSRGAIMA